MAEKIAAAKAYLGTGWVLHPAYNPAAHPAHRTKEPYCLNQLTRLKQQA